LTGLVDLPEDPDRLAATLDETGTAYELLSAEEVKRRFDLVTDCYKAVWQPDAGVVRADRALAAFARGLEVREGTAVRSLVPGRVDTDGGVIEADTVVVAAGGWVDELAPGLPVTPTRETVSYFRLPDERAVPSVIDYANRETYALTAGPGLLKVGVHRTGPPTEPARAGTPDEDIVRFASEWAARTFPLATPDPAAVETCIYTNTDDARFMVERRDSVVVCSACSGHGFKFAPAVGVRVAELVAG
jgi:sarcosine oxidase